jgi:hypothetical protein
MSYKQIFGPEMMLIIMKALARKARSLLYLKGVWKNLWV